MYRKLFIIFAALGLMIPSAKAASQKDLDKALEQAVSRQQQVLPMSPSPLAHKKGVLPIKLTVGAYFTEADADNDSLVKECPAVRISSHYLLASMACVGLSDTGTLYRYTGAGGGYNKSEQKVVRWIENVKIGKQIISKDNIAYSKESKLILVRIDPENKELKEAVQSKPAVNLFIPKNPQLLKSTFSNIKLNREELICSGRTCANVKISDVCTETGCFRLGWKFIDGDTGDPVFGLNPAKSTEEFLLGFNLTDVKVTDRQAGRDYHFFSANTIKFLQENIQTKSPADWEQIKKKMVDENYFN